MTSSRVASAPVAWQRCLFDQWAKYRERERKGIVSGWKREGKIGRRAPSFLFSSSALFSRCWLYFYALLDSSPSARRHFNWTEQSSSFPSSFEGCQPCIQKTTLLSLKLPYLLRARPLFPPLHLLHLLEDSGALERENFNICFRFEIVCARSWLFALDFIGVPTSLEMSKVQRNIDFKTLAKLFFEDTNLGNQANKNRKIPSSLHAFLRQLRLSPRNYRVLITLARPLIVRKLCSMLEPKFMTRNCTYATADNDDER